MPTHQSNPQPERISPDDMAYHVRVVEQLEQAQVVYQSWANHLLTKYQLQGSDSISKYGIITRSPADTDTDSETGEKE